MTMTAHAYALIDSYIYGFALQEANLPATQGDELVDLAETILEPLPQDHYPHLMEFITEHTAQPGSTFATSSNSGSTSSWPGWPPTPHNRGGHHHRLLSRG